MTAVSLLAVGVLLLAPGFSLLPARLPLRLRLPFVFSVSFVVTSCLGLLLLVAGRFDPVIVAVCELPLLARPVYRRAWPRLGLGQHRFSLLLFGLLAVLAIATVGEDFDGNGDSGVYTISALHIHQTGAWSWTPNEWQPQADLPTDILTYSRHYAQPWQEVAPGFIVDAEDQVSPQFLPLFPLWGAVFSAALPEEGAIYGIVVASLLGIWLLLLCLHTLAHFLFGKTASNWALILVVANPVFLIFLTYPTAECFLAGILAACLLWSSLFLYRPRFSSAVLPAVLLGLGILTKFFAWAVAGTLLLVVFLLPARRWLSASPILAAVIVSAVAGIGISGPHLANHLGQLQLLASFKIALGATIALAAARIIWTRCRNWIIPALGVTFIAGTTILWAQGAVIRDGLGAILHDLGTLWGWPILVIGAIGLYRSCWRRTSIAALLPILIFITLTTYLLLGSGDSVYYPFAARRFLVVTLPLLSLFAAGLLSRQPRLAPLVVALALLPPLVNQRDVIALESGTGFTATLDQLERSVADQQLVFATRSAWRYAPHLLLNRERPVYCVDLDTIADQKRVSDALRRTGNAALITSEHEARMGDLAATEDRPKIRPDRHPSLARGRIKSEFRLLRLEPTDGLARRVLDIGGRDLLFVTGFHSPERARDRSYRWTKWRSQIRLRPGRRVRFTWSSGGHPEKPVPVALLADGERIGYANVQSKWKTSRWFALPESDRELVVEIRTHVFQPAAIGRGGDQRQLGIRLDRIEVSAQPPP